MIVDAHCHTSDRWYEPVEVLVSQMDRIGIDTGVLTQYSGQFDNSYQAECVRRFPDRLVSVVVVDTASPDAPQKLNEWVEDGAVGLRLRALARSEGSDPLALWRRAAELGITVTSLGSEAEFLDPRFEEVLREFPELQITIEHLGTRGKTGLSYSTEDAGRVFALSRYQNANLKFHGLAEFSPRTPDRTAFEPFVTPLRPHLKMALEAFGADRLIWGSDFPPVSAREGYEAALKYPLRAFRDLGASETEIGKLFGGNAARLFRVPGRQPVGKGAFDAVAG